MHHPLLEAIMHDASNESADTPATPEIIIALSGNHHGFAGAVTAGLQIFREACEQLAKSFQDFYESAEAESVFHTIKIEDTPDWEAGFTVLPSGSAMLVMIYHGSQKVCHSVLEIALIDAREVAPDPEFNLAPTVPPRLCFHLK
jgi:hypothetical protein